MHVFARNFGCQLEKAFTELGQYQCSVTVLKDYVEKSFLKYINNDGVPCSDSSETKIYALNSSLLKTKQVVDILFTQIRTILLKLLCRAMLPTNTSIIKGYLIFYVSLIFTT